MRKRQSLTLEMQLAPFQMRYFPRSCASSPLNELLPQRFSPRDGGICSRRWFATHHLNTISNSTPPIYFIIIPGRTGLRDSGLSSIQHSLRSDDDDGGHRCPIKKLSLKVEHGFDQIESHANWWISSALERGASELDLRITMPFVPDPDEPELLEPYRWPLLPTLFTSDTLVKLTLGTRVYVGDDDHRTDEVLLPVLKSLFLYTVCFEDDDLRDFLCGCPVLEELYIDHTNIDPECTFKNRSPNHQETHSSSGSSFSPLPCRGIQHTKSCLPRLLWSCWVVWLLLRRFRWFPCRSTHRSRSSTWLPVRTWRYFEIHFLGMQCSNPSPLFFYRWGMSFVLMYIVPSFHHQHFVFMFPFLVFVCLFQVMCESLDYWRTNGGFPLFKNLVCLSFESKTKKVWKVLWSLINSSPMLENLIIKVPLCL